MPGRLDQYRPVLEQLEDRTVPYALSGYKWAVPNVSASYLPDGTPTGGSTSNLFATMDARTSTADWQREIARALQTWASVSTLNFHFVADGGQPSGTSGLIQGDSRFGDIRVGARALSTTSSYVAYTYFPYTTTTWGGDITLNSTQTFNVGTKIDLYSAVLHEVGHTLGLGHSGVPGAVMYPVYQGVLGGLTADDIAGIQAVYGARRPDAYDVRASNDSLSSATPLTLDGSGAATSMADLTTLADVDCYRFTVPTGFGGSWTISMDAHGLSLLSPMLSVYDAAGNLVARASAGSAYATAAMVTLTGLVAGQTYTVVADGATADVFGMGAYVVSVKPTGTLPATDATSTGSDTATTTTTSSGPDTSTPSTGSDTTTKPIKSHPKQSAGLKLTGGWEKAFHAQQLLPPRGGDGLVLTPDGQELGHTSAPFPAPPGRPDAPDPGRSHDLASGAASPLAPADMGPGDDDFALPAGPWVDPGIPPL